MRILLLALALMVPWTASAQSDHEPSNRAIRNASIVFGVSATADWAMTGVSLYRGGRELNPSINWIHQPVAMIAAGAAMDLAGLYAWNRVIGTRHPRLAVTGLYVASAFRVYLAYKGTRRDKPIQWGGPGF